MAWTETILEVTDDHFPLCARTLPPYPGHAWLRVTDSGVASGRFSGFVTYAGPPGDAEHLARDLGAARAPGATLQRVASTATLTVMRFEVGLEEAEGPYERLIALFSSLHGLGEPLLIEPLLACGGRLRTRLLVPSEVPSERAISVLQGLQRSGAFRDARILRMGPFDALHHVDMLRPLISPGQEDILRVAVDLGYYENPKRTSLDDIADRLRLTVSPVHKRLKDAEEALVSAYVGREARGVPRRRIARGKILTHLPAGPVEITLAASTPDHPLSTFAQTHPGALCVVQGVSPDRIGDHSCALVVGATARQDQTELVHQLRIHPSVHMVEELSAGNDHVSLRIRANAGEDAPWSFYGFHAVFGEDILLRPVVFEGREAHIRLTLWHAPHADEVRAKLEKVAAILGWEKCRVIHASDLANLTHPPHLPEPLSARQEEVLKIAHALGYYRTPRGCTLEQVAGTLGVSANAIHKNLTGAELKLIAWRLAARP